MPRAQTRREMAALDCIDIAQRSDLVLRRWYALSSVACARRCDNCVTNTIQGFNPQARADSLYVMTNHTSYELAALEWQIELGADESIGDEPVNRFKLVVEAPKSQPAAPAAATATATVKDTPSPIVASPQPEEISAAAIASAQTLAASANTLDELRAALTNFDGCALKKGARNTVFADGNKDAHLMIIGEAPGRDEDLAGKPFVGRSGELLDKMLAAINLSRNSEAPQTAVYITNVLPWRPPQNRDPATDEVAMLNAFLLRHIALKKPRVLVTMGNAATKSVLDTATGIMRMRGTWASYGDIPVLPMLHPAALLRNPAQKRDSWADLLSLQAKLETVS